jgi:hypothetical protein
LTVLALDHFNAEENSFTREDIECRPNFIRIDAQEASQVISADDLSGSHRPQSGVELLEDTRKVRILFS